MCDNGSGLASGRCEGRERQAALLDVNGIKPHLSKQLPCILAQLRLSGKFSKRVFRLPVMITNAIDSQRRLPIGDLQPPPYAASSPHKQPAYTAPHASAHHSPCISLLPSLSTPPAPTFCPVQCWGLNPGSHVFIPGIPHQQAAFPVQKSRPFSCTLWLPVLQGSSTYLQSTSEHSDHQHGHREVIREHIPPWLQHPEGRLLL